MSDLRLKTAVGSYGHTAALKDHSVPTPGLEFDFVEVTPIIAAFRRMVRGLEFDVTEMALSTYLVAREYDKPFTALPIFVVRGFAHGGIVCNKSAGIRKPTDLEGKKVGVRAYTVTTGVWARGILAHQYGVDPDKITWVVVDEEHVAEYRLPKNVEVAPAGANLAALLEAGEIAAGIGLGGADSPNVEPLIADVPAAERAWLAESGAYPINHTVVVKDSLLAEHPALAGQVYAAFDAAKQAFLQRMDRESLSGPDAAIAKRRAIVGPDPLPYGLAANRTAVETLIRFAQEQHLLTRPITVDDLFVPIAAGDSAGARR